MSDLGLKDAPLSGEVARPASRDRETRDEAREAAKNIFGSVNRSDAPPLAINLARQHPIAIAIGAVAAIAAVSGGVTWWLNARHYQSTDDAFIDARTVSISSQLVGMITGVPVTDNQLVDTGGLLVQIDSRDYEAAVAQAEAQANQAKAAVDTLDAQIDAQKARIDQAQKQALQTRAVLTFARQQNDRAQDLVRRGAGTPQEAQQTTSNFNQGVANLASAQDNEEAAQKARSPVLEAQRRSATATLAQMQAALKLTQINVTRTRITAPEPGRTTNMSAALGKPSPSPGQC